MCIKGMANEVEPRVPYELKRNNPASSHPSPSSISFFSFPVKLGMSEDWNDLYNGKQPAKKTWLARTKPHEEADRPSKLRRT